MKLNLVGVLVDGPGRASGVPENPRKALTWPVGSSVSIRVDVVSSQSGIPVDLSGSTVRFEARLRPLPYSLPKLLDVVGVALSPVVKGSVSIEVTPAMQKLIAQRNIGRCFYDVWLVDSSGKRDAVVPTSPLFFEPSVTGVP